ncbi:MAG: S8 family serine peptidase [Thermoplasmata archaeon]
MIGTDDGLAIDAALGAGSTFTLDPASQAPIPNRIVDFSSRGPRFGDSALKPDITAPGTSVSSVLFGSGTGATVASGTSMASPHVAGSAALLRELHPDWSVEEIKAVLMNTATDASPNGLPYPVSRMGAGIVQVDVAVDTESVVVPASASFGVEERDHGKKKFKVQLEVRNMGDETKKFELSSDFLFPNDDEGSIDIKHPKKIKVKPGESKKIKLELKVDFKKLAPESLFEEYDGFLTLTETTSGGDVLRVPFHIIPIARADAEAKDDKIKLPKDTTLKFRNKGMRGTFVDIYQFGVSDPNEDLISEASGAPNDPDDWFDIRHTGAHSLFGGAILEFAMTTHGSRSVANFMETDIFIDVDGGGPDYFALAIDYGVFTGAFPDGRIVSGIFEASTGLGFLQFFIGNDPNTAIQTIPFFLDDLNLLGSIFGAPLITPGDPDFDYFAATFDFETGSFDVTDSASFNAITPEIDTSPNFFFLPADSKATVGVLASAKGGILALYLNNIAGPDQSEVIKVKVK